MVRRGRVIRGTPQWFKNLDCEKRIQQAILNAELHFTGLSRINQIRNEDTPGPVSLRTRHSLRTPADDLGVIQRATPKYDANGLLNWGFAGLLNVRLDDAGVGILCQLQWDRQDTSNVSWENLYAVLSRDTEWKFRYFYRSKISPASRVTLLEMETTALPRRVLELGLSHGSLDAFVPGTNGSVKFKSPSRVVLEKWTRLADRWDNKLAKLQNTSS